MDLGISSDAEIRSSPYAGLFTWDCRSSTVYADKALATLYGLEGNEAEMGLPLQDFVSKIHAEDRANFGDTARNSLLKRVPFQAGYRVVRPDGTVQPVLAFSQPFFDRDGVLIFYSGIIIPSRDTDNNLEALLWHSVSALELAHSQGRREIASILSAAIAVLTEELGGMPSNDN